MASREDLGERRKLIDALYELSKDNFCVSDDTILDKLYVHIEKKANGEDFSELLRDFGVWLEHVLKLWNKSTLCGGVRVLFIRLLGLIGSKPDGFTAIKLMLPEIEKLLSSSEVQNDSSLMVPLVNDLALFSYHLQGLIWVLNSGVWKQAVKAFYENRSIYINRSVIKFISLLLSKVDWDVNTVVAILNYVGKPLVDNCLLTVQPFQNLEEDEVQLKENLNIFNGNTTGLPLDTHVNSIEKILAIENLARAAKFLCDVLDDLISNNKVLPIDFDYNITTELSSEDFPSSQDYQTVLQLMVMLELSAAWWLRILAPQEPGPCVAHSLYQVVRQMVRSLLKLGHFNQLLDLCIFCLGRVFRYRLGDGCSQCKALEDMLVEQLRMFLTLHSTCFCTETCRTGNPCKLEELITSVNHSIQDCLKKFHEVRLSQVQSFQYFHRGVFAATRSVNFFYNLSSWDNISLVLMEAFYSAKGHWWLENAVTSSSLLSLIALASKLVERYNEPDISRKLMPIVTWLLGEENEDARITVSTLQLLKKILKTQVIPELIMKCPETMDGMRFRLIDYSYLMKHLGNPSSWEIRDTALEVYQFLVELNELTCGLFSSLMFYENLYSDVMGLAANDASAYVRSSTLTFLAKAVRAKVLLDKISSRQLSDLAIKTLLEDEMPEPRMAACDLLTAMYVTSLLTDQGMPEKLYATMFTASMKELDWEVKKATLRFWQCAVSKHYMSDVVLSTHPSMLRSSDPSAEEKEDLVLKMIRIMETLSDIGCLKVIWTDVIDESDISVSQAACHVIDTILGMDKDWNFIEKIINSAEMEMDEENLASKKLTSKQFCTNICKKGWREKLAARKNWIEITCDDLPSLLDHILTPDNGDWDRNAVDCY